MYTENVFQSDANTDTNRKHIRGHHNNLIHTLVKTKTNIQFRSHAVDLNLRTHIWNPKQVQVLTVSLHCMFYLYKIYLTAALETKSFK